MTKIEDQDEKKAVEIAKSYMLNQQGMMSFDDHVNYLSGLISSALRTAREDAYDECAKISDEKAEFHVKKLNEAITEASKLAHDVAQAALHGAAAQFRSRKAT